MKKILIAAALIVSGLLSGCNQLTQYTVSEQEINQLMSIIIPMIYLLLAENLGHRGM